MKRLCLAALLTLTAHAAQPAKNASADYKVAVTTRVFHPETGHPDIHRNWRGSEKHELDCTLWYPATDSAVETPQTIGPPDAPLFLAGSAARSVPMNTDADKRPLVLLSHGSGGTAAQMAWLGTALARAGFIAIAVNHPGNNGVEPYTAEGFSLWWERATDLSEVLDGILADEDFGPHIDRKSIGAAGFSLGGYTVMELAGARTDQQVVLDDCHAHPEKAVCHAPEMHELGTPDQLAMKVRKTSRESLARQGESFADDRIRAAFAMAPAVSNSQTADSLHDIHIPVMLVVGSADPLAPPAENADYLRANIRSAREITLPGVVHYTFLDTCTAAGKAALPTYCVDPAGVDRDAIHGQVADLAVQFFGKTLHWR